MSNDPGGNDPGWDDADDYVGSEFARVFPLQPDDPPRIGSYWIDARLTTAACGTAYTAHTDDDVAAMVIVLAEGAASDAAARERFAGVVNEMHIDTVLARGGQGQDTGRLGRKYAGHGGTEDQPTAPDDSQPAPWVALDYDGSAAAAAESQRVLDEVQLSVLPPQGRPSGPDYRHYWIDRIRPGLARLWPLPWPGRFDRAGWRTILVSWLLMVLLAALAVLIAILIFRNQAPQTPPPPTGSSGSPPPQSSSPSPQSGSPSPQSGSPSPQSGSPSPSPSGSGSGSPSQSASPSPSGSGSASPSPSGSESGQPSPSGSQSGSGQPTPSDSGPPQNSETPRSRL